MTVMYIFYQPVCSLLSTDLFDNYMKVVDNWSWKLLLFCNPWMTGDVLGGQNTALIGNVVCVCVCVRTRAHLHVWSLHTERLALHIVVYYHKPGFSNSVIMILLLLLAKSSLWMCNGLHIQRICLPHTSFYFQLQHKVSFQDPTCFSCPL